MVSALVSGKLQELKAMRFKAVCYKDLDNYVQLSYPCILFILNIFL